MTIEVTAVIDFFYLLDTPYEYILVRLENAYEEGIVNLKTMQRWTSKIRNGKQILTINRGQGNPDETKNVGNQNHD
jgi:aspartyl aminopeptidase